MNKINTKKRNKNKTEMKKPKQKKNKQNQQTKATISIKPKLLTLAIAQALALQAVQAATIEVTSNLDDGADCTLREAIESVNAGDVGTSECSYSGTFGSNDEITFAPSVSGSTITLAGSQIEIEKSVSINPAGSDVAINGNYASRIFYSSAYGITVDLDHLTLTNGNTGSDGGAIFIRDGTLKLLNSTISASTAGDSDGGLSAVDSDVSLTNSIVSGNLAEKFAGGIGVYGGKLTLIDSTVWNNTASSYGGGGMTCVGSSVVDIKNSKIIDNTAAFSGGVFVSTLCTLDMVNSQVSGNYATSAGGGISTGGENAKIVLRNSTVSNNTSTNAGGGLKLNDSEVNLYNCTIANNKSAFGGGIFMQEGGNLSANNSIVADNQNDTSEIDCTKSSMNSSVVAGSDNIIETDSCGTGSMNIDPGLLPLADNGGDTFTHALMPGSPAIDAGANGTCEATDQRGETRDDGACDIGAYEFDPTMAPVTPIASKDRKMGALINGSELWYSFNSTESQELSIQTNGFSGDTLIEFYAGSDPKQVNPQLNMDDDSGPDLFSNIKHNVNNGPYLIRVKGKTAVDPYWLRLMSDRDILSFGDTGNHFANKEIRVMSSAGITGGCGTGIYCPTSPVTRAQMAIFMLKAILGGNHSSPPASGTVFSDVSTSSFGASFIEEFSTLGITSGCGGGKYCPDLAVTREQMAVFLLRAWYGSSYMPPAATPVEINQFSDIANSFAKDWIVQLTKENITGGCGGGKFCPTDTVTRGQMAAFIARTFSLDTEL